MSDEDAIGRSSVPGIDCGNQLTPEIHQKIIRTSGKFQILGLPESSSSGGEKSRCRLLVVMPMTIQFGAN